MARTLTAANSIITIGIEGLYSTPQQLQGYAADNVTSLGDVSPAEVLMGVDGKLSGGFVFNPVVQNINLQADSLSCDIFDRWYAAQQQARETYIAIGVVLLPATNKKYSLTRGFLTGYKPAPDVQRILQPRQFAITWERVSPALV